ncbi:MAG: NADPH-dependent glutamate synthase [Fimbriimonadales bacterium]|nr:NADPH-dependent glutamate synthase [Fimbriimonadales bacterium]
MPENSERPEELLRRADELTPKERMAIPRQPMPERPAEERRRDQSEVPLGFDELHAVIEACRCLECKSKPCVQGCPVGVDIPAFIRLIRQGDFEGAIAKIRECNCLPAVTGRVCPQEEQCQLHCTLAKARKDPEQAVSIGRLERFVADWERGRERPTPETKPSPTGKRVAIVGSGPAGLSAAGDLVRMGHEVTVFEAFHKFGGVLVYGIPEFRLPKEIVDDEVGRLVELGVRFEANVVVGQTVTIDELLEEEGFDAVFLGTGAGLPLFLGVPGEELIGVYSANEYLTRANLMRAYEFPKVDTPIVRAGRVAVVGGGNVAMDAARTALRLGAQEVTLVYRRSRTEMPARAEEIHHAEEEGVQFLLLANPVAILGDETGRVRALRCVRMELGEPDASGRRRPVAVPGSEFDLPAELVIVAIGNGPNPLATSTTPDLKTDSRGRIVVDPATGKTSKRGVFAGGDVVLGAATVILAMGEGRKAARAIDRFLATGEW